MNESELQNAVKIAAKHLGFEVYHTHYSIGSDPGFPDLHIVGRCRRRRGAGSGE